MLVDAALSAGGRFYLPYRLAYSSEQLKQSYPQIEQFFALKHQYDPDERFSNKFYEQFKRFMS